MRARNMMMDVCAYEKAHGEAVRALAPECAVLLRSNGAFPLETPGELALYGNGARHTQMGGTGSGEVNTRRRVTAEQGLEAAGFTITTKDWLDGYDRVALRARRTFVKALRARARKHRLSAVLEGMGAATPEPEYRLALEAGGDAAVYVLARTVGEGKDREPAAGDILLTETELRDILALNRRYHRFLLVLNVGAPVDLSPLEEVENILLLSQLGADTGHVLADLLTGSASPSGKLAATWNAWESRCELGEFGERDDTRYREGVYVGYRYYDSLGQKPLFPFGFGLSYTTFSLAPSSVSAEGDCVTLRVLIRNTGARPGREVAQLYISAPGRTLDVPWQSLAAFAKTGELQPGGEETVSLRFRLRDIASYDTLRQCWFLDGGDYVLRLGNSSASALPCAVLRLNMDVITRRVRNSCGVPSFVDWKPGHRRVETLPDGLPVVCVDGRAIPVESVCYERKAQPLPVIHAMKNRELAYLCVGAFSAGAGAVIGDKSKRVAGAAGETTDRFKKRGVKPLVLSDGPAGLRLSPLFRVDAHGAHTVGRKLPPSMAELLPAWQAAALRLADAAGRRGGRIQERYATAIPIATALAQSWNPELAEACGDIVGDEMERFGVQVWLAPALNIQRDIRCGRNFEYFSEDPLLSGRFAAALTRGVQKHPGCAATVKHFAANNQETNRFNSNSQVSERAMREIYLRGFEICVREAGPMALMTSYNLLNGVHTSEHRGLVEDILRCEFGFDGLVMTDWIAGRGLFSRGAKYPAPAADRIAAAGGDLIMPGEQRDVDDLLRGLKNGTLSREQLERCASRAAALAGRL